MVKELGRSSGKMSINFKEGGIAAGVTQQYGDVGSSGQVWTNVFSNRSATTWYQNTTGKPIQLAIGHHRDAHLWIGPATNNYVEVVHTGGDYSESMNEAIVPVNHYYQSEDKRTWTEFR